VTQMGRVRPTFARSRRSRPAASTRSGRSRAASGPRCSTTWVSRAALTERAAASGTIEVRREIDRSLPELGDEVDLVVFRVAQESLTNVIRHSGAGAVAVSLSKDGQGGIVLVVEDDGRGIDGTAQPGTGMQGMLERAVLIGSALDFEAPATGGTRVVLRVPAEALGGRR
jgi:signal transduction histidine kinase